MLRTLLPAACLIFFASLPPAAGAQTTVLAFGDSITRGLGDGEVSCSSGSPGGYPPRLRSELSNRGLSTEIRTFGVCGELTSQGVTRIDQVLDENVDADVIVIMEGTNDLSNNSISTESMRFNLERMTEKSFAALVRPVLASPIPRAPEAGSNTRTAFLAALLREDAEAADIDFSDQYNQLIGISNLFSNFYSDPFHPNSLGYGLVADRFVDPVLSAASRPLDVEPCVPGPETLCLNQERFKIEVEWQDFEGNVGTGKAETLTPDTGYFWFFDPANVELVLKVLDGQAFNDRYWVFYGALSTVRYTISVIDTERGLRKVYENPIDNLASVGDTDAFPGDPPESGVTVLAPFPAASTGAGLGARGAGKEESCTVDDESLCLNESRFQVRARWADFDGNSGIGKAVELTEDTGYFWFFAPTNVEVMVKVLDGLGFNNAYWVFFGALSNVEFEIEVTDTLTGDQVTYTNPSGNFGSRADTEAFPQPVP